MRPQVYIGGRAKVGLHLFIWKISNLNLLLSHPVCVCVHLVFNNNNHCSH